MIRMVILMVARMKIRLMVILLFGDAIITHTLACFIHLADDILPSKIAYPNNAGSHGDDVAITLQPSLSGTYHDEKLSSVLLSGHGQNGMQLKCSGSIVSKSRHSAAPSYLPRHDRRRRGLLHTAELEKDFTERWAFAVEP